MMTYFNKEWNEGETFSFPLSDDEKEWLNVGDYVVIITGITVDNNCRVYGQITDLSTHNYITIYVERTVMV